MGQPRNLAVQRPPQSGPADDASVSDFQAQFRRGVDHLRQGELEAAAVAFRAALTLHPRDFNALNALGLSVMASGDAPAAIPLFEDAIALKPDFVDVRNNLGLALLLLRRHEPAATAFAAALALNPDHAPAHHGLGCALKDLDRLGESIAHLERAIALVPNFASAHNDLAISLQASNRPLDALIHYDRAIAISPKIADFHHNRGMLLENFGRLDEAGEAFATAITLDPQKPRHYRSLARHRRFIRGDLHLAAMETLLQRVDALPVDEQIELHYALADSLSELRRHDDAFSHLLAGGALKRGRTRYDERATLGLFERVKNLFTAEFLDGRRGSGDPTETPVFVIGMPRSGTTLVEQVLASHPSVHGAGELRTFQQGVEVLRKNLGVQAQFPEIAELISNDHLRQVGAFYSAAIRMLAPSAARVVDKLPVNFFGVGLIRLALPNARFIHVRRDPFDTCVSLFSKLFANGQSYSYDLAEIGRYYRAYEDLMTHWRAILPEDVMIEVRYEDLVADLEGQARRLLSHAGLGWNDACLEFHRTQRFVQTASVIQVRQPIYESSIGRWKPYARNLRPLFEALGRPAA